MNKSCNTSITRHNADMILVTVDISGLLGMRLMKD